MRKTCFLLIFLTASIGVCSRMPERQTVREVADFPAEDFASQRTFTLSGMVTAEDGDTIVLEDETAALRISNESTPPIRPQPGALVRVFGHGYSSTRLMNHHCAQKIKVVGHKSLPIPIDLTPSLALDTAQLYRRIRLTGVISFFRHDSLDPRYTWMQLRTEAGNIAVALRECDYPTCRANDLSDAEVSVIGHMTPSVGWRSALGPHLLVMTTNALSVVKPPPEQPFDAPVLFSHNYPHRQKVSSVVIAATAQCAYLRDADQRLICILPAQGQPAPRAGDLVTAVGFVEPDAFCIRLAEALCRCERREPPPRDTPDTMTDPNDMHLGADSADRLNTRYNGTIVRLRGTVRELHSPSQLTGTFLLDSGKYAYLIDASALGLSDNAFEPKSVVDVTGFCLAEVETPTSRLVFPRTKGFSVIPRSATDLVIVSRPPFWTPRRLFVIILVLSACMLGFAIWNWQLTTHSERRGRELAQERLAHARAEEKVKERTRLAVELHDSISQTLTGVALHLDSAVSVSQGIQPKMTVFLSTARDMLASCRRELQACLWDLRSRTFEEKDMTEAVQRAIGPYIGETPTTVRFNVPRQILSESVTHTVLLIVRELAVNALRHGQAHHLKIAGEFKQGQIRFSVRDDGRGFDPTAVQSPQTGHFGLQGIRERLKDFAGTLVFERLSDNGMRATVTMIIIRQKAPLQS